MEAILLLSAIAAVIGGVINTVDTINTNYDELDRLDAEKKRVEDAYDLQNKQAEDEYSAAKETAEKNAERAKQNADLTDLGQDIAEKSLSNDFNSAIDQLYLSQASDTVSWNNAAMQAASSTGANYANLAASGVRAGGSLSNAILMESATNSAQLQFSQDTKRRQDNNNLASVLNNLAGGKYSIYGNRLNADITRGQANDLINSYGVGGSNYNLYQDQLKIMKLKKDQEIDRLDEKKQDIWDNFQTQIFTSFFNGASKGASTGYKAGTSFYEAAKYTT